ncbi:MAG: outer membrane protein assembly factor BamE (lipoprotein component of BamABCDE complex) [Halioglobus sp.]|jgi:outer membrane protein assembly factor BamE (lipoprotein component of BamABCDE complex)
MKPLALLAALALGLSLLQGCAQYENKRGVDVRWQDSVTTQLSKGSSTRSDVLALLGPPSQVISLDGETVFYYLFEHTRGNGIILLVYNRTTVETQYDRAVFFFDDNDVLTEYSTRVYDS